MAELYMPWKKNKPVFDLDDLLLMESAGDKYMRDTIQYAKDHPTISIGMMVADQYGNTGRIVGMKWSESYMDHVCDVMSGHDLVRDILGTSLKRTTVKAVVRCVK